MKILLINSHHKIIGGAERYYFESASLLAKAGHQVAFFSMRDIRNEPTKWSRYFISRVTFSKNNIKGFVKKIFRMFYSIESKHKISKLLNDFKPDIVHINNIYYYISPSILGEIKKRNIPIVQTVHDYQTISPSITFFHDGRICEITKKNKFYKAVIHKCVKHSYLASFMAVVASYIQYAISYDTYIDFFITPSQFAKNKLTEYGINSRKIIHLNNFIETVKKVTKSQNKDRYVLYFGRVEEAKGIKLIIEVAELLPEVKFKIAGNFEGQKEKLLLLQTIRDKKIKNIFFLGFKSKNEINKLIINSEFVIVPSVWYENQPYSILESFALGKTVLGSNIGGISEVISNRHNGLLFNLNRTKDFKNKIKKLWNNPKLTNELGKNAYKTITSKFNKESHYNKLIDIYAKASRLH